MYTSLKASYICKYSNIFERKIQVGKEYRPKEITTFFNIRLWPLYGDGLPLAKFSKFFKWMAA